MSKYWGCILAAHIRFLSLGRSTGTGDRDDELPRDSSYALFFPLMACEFTQPAINPTERTLTNSRRPLSGGILTQLDCRGNRDLFFVIVSLSGVFLGWMARGDSG